MSSDENDPLLEESEPVDDVQEQARGNGYRYFDEKGEHLHTLGGRPLLGTSTVNKEAGAGLIWWAAGEALKSLGWRNPRTETMANVVAAAERALDAIKNMSLDEYVQLLQSCYRAHDTKKNKAAKDGTNMHADLESYVKSCMKDNGGQPIELPPGETPVQRFAAWAIENVQFFLWHEAHCYSATMWVGGISDCGAEMRDGKIAVIDFKSAKQAYYEHFRQAGGYAQQIEENGLYTADGTQTHAPMKIGELVIFPFGGVPKTIYAVEDYQRAFVGKLDNYKLQKSFAEMAVI